MPREADIAAFVVTQVSEGRWAHIRGVADTAAYIARGRGLDVDAARVAGFLHDVCKEAPLPELVTTARAAGIPFEDDEAALHGLMHAAAGAAVAKTRFGIVREDVLEAIRFHPTGRAGLLPLAQVLYVADYTEAGRPWGDKEEIADLAYVDLPRAVLRTAALKIKHLLDEGRPIHPRSIECWNYFARECASRKAP